MQTYKIIFKNCGVAQLVETETDLIHSFRNVHGATLIALNADDVVVLAVDKTSIAGIFLIPKKQG